MRNGVRRHLLPKILGQGHKVATTAESNNFCFQGHRREENAMVLIATCVPMYVGAIAQPSCLVGSTGTLLACQIY